MSSRRCTFLRDIGISVAACVLLLSCSNDSSLSSSPSSSKEQSSPSTSQPNDPFPIITVAAPTHDFGEVKQGDVVEHIFVIKNTGNKDLVIDRAKGS